MKVFISWSGETSHKVALVLKEWLPSILQSIEFYVSSEDINKGVRWGLDIAKELESCSSGILCVTKDNVDAPWLNFEAGALSKTIDTSLVIPFLFDIKNSELKGPLVQFQSALFDKDDIYRLIHSLNNASDSPKNESIWSKAFHGGLYSNLEAELNKIKETYIHSSKKGSGNESESSQILEEILTLTRNNQILLRNPEIDSKIFDHLIDLKVLMQDQLLMLRMEKKSDADHSKRISKKLNTSFIEDILLISFKDGKSLLGFLMVLGFFRNDFPWIYDAGKELVDVLRSNIPKEDKLIEVSTFQELIKFTFKHPMMVEVFDSSKEYELYMNEIPLMLNRYMENI